MEGSWRISISVRVVGATSPIARMTRGLIPIGLFGQDVFEASLRGVGQYLNLKRTLVVQEVGGVKGTGRRNALDYLMFRVRPNIKEVV
jgi:hypothetical protein